MGFADFRQRHRAEIAKRGKQPATTTAAGSPAPSADALYITWRDQCRSDWKRVKAIADHAGRDQLKARLLGNYRDYLKGWIDQKETHSNEVLVVNLIWAGDCAEWVWFMALLDAVRETDQIMPEFTGFKSNPVTLAADIVFQAAEKDFKSDQAVIEPFKELLADIESSDLSINNSLEARYYKLAGEIAEYREEHERALAYYLDANRLKSDIGVKGRIKRLESLLPRQASGTS